MIKCAEKSPRICKDGSIRWYAGDTFILHFNLEFSDDDGNNVPTNSSDEITICFRDALNNVVHEEKVVGTNVLTLNIDEETTKSFKQGEYHYCVRRNADFITTLMRKNKVVVE